jgi:hypothetical protein
MLQIEELNSSNIPQRINALLDLEEQRMFDLGEHKEKTTNCKEIFQ